MRSSPPHRRGDLLPIDFEDLPKPLAELLAARVERLGYLGDFFRYMAHQPRALAAFIEFTEALKAELPARLSSTVALAVAAQLDNHYERNQHEQLARRQGASDEWIRAAVTGTGFDELAAPAEIAVRAVVRASGRDRGHGSSQEFAALVRAVGPATAVAIVLLIGRYQAHGIVSNVLGLIPPVPSIGRAS